MSNLNSCPFCGGAVRWCDSVPDDDGDAHECEHITCEKCQVSLTLTGSGHEGCETFAEAKVKMEAIWNLRSA